MNQVMFDVACFTFAGGACAGSFIGYWVRGIKERYKRAQTDRAWVASKQTPRKYDAVTGQVTNRVPIKLDHTITIERRIEAQQARDVLSKSNQVIPITRAKNPTPQTMADRPLTEQVREADRVENEMHADVVAALVAQGFKVGAAKAANACTESERVNIETWIRAALANAINARSSQ